jgi:glycosyltransferase involved in cell wall biosynthesis
MKKKVLVYATLEDLKPTGGPSGYLYNLIDYFRLGKSNEINIEFLKKQDEKINDYIGVKLYQKRISYFNNLIIKPLKLINQFLPFLTYTKIIFSKGDRRISSYEVIHFHSTFEMYQNRKLLKKKYIILQSHSPVPAHQEMFDGTNFRLYRKILQFFFRVCDTYSFSRADTIIFPVLDAMEAYKKCRPLAVILNKKVEKISYLPTGILDLMPVNFDTYELFEKKDPIVFGFLGRHIEIKGYDIFVRVFSKFINNNLLVVVGGDINKRIPFPQRVEWKEFGFIDKVKFFNKITILVVPNRETYFDLVVLEALSMGKVLILSSTGGNKYFLKFGELINKSIYFYETESELKRIVTTICSLSIDSIKQLGLKNRALYLTFFTSKVLYESYLELLETALKDSSIQN